MKGGRETQRILVTGGAGFIFWATNAIGTKHIIRLQEKQKFRLAWFSPAVRKFMAIMRA
jgi:hypothetical protein